MSIRRLTDPQPFRRAELRNLAEARIERRAYYDPLTGLPNRTLFERRVSAAIEDFGRRQRGFALLNLDLDEFGKINGSIGHAAGDELLRRFAPRLARAIGPSDTVCRAGADEFLLLLADTASFGQACRAASKLMVTLSRPIVVSGRPLQARVSVGISLFPEQGADGQTLIDRASEALAQAKREGPVSIRVFGESQDLRASA